MMYNQPVRRRKRWPLALFIITVGIIIAAFIAFLWYQDSLLAPSSENITKVFIINPNESVSSITSRLEKEKLIKNSLAFKAYLKGRGLDNKIQTGDFKLRTNMKAEETAENLIHGAIDIWVTFPEGWRVEEMAEELNKKLGIPISDFITQSQEGYMFPDTYLIPKDSTAKDVTNILLNNFHKRLKENNLPETGSGGLTFKEKIILASLVEREATAGLAERATIAGIILNRLERGMALDIDASVQYDQGTSGNWWPKLTADKLKIDSPSNTYTRPGLPLAPICNPGIESIKAAFNPTETDYFYYLHGRDGQIHYAKTIEEHNQNVADYIN